jgi:exodeoxyribonuclease VII small subunit
MDFEKKLNRLEEIVAQMEGGALTLEDSLKHFEEGVKLSRECNTQLLEAEQKVKLLLQVDADGNATTKDFQIEEQ